MKKMLLMLAIAYSPIITTKPSLAMVASETSTLAHIIRPKFAADMITFVKKISENYLVFFDRKGRGELWRINGEPTFIKEFENAKIFSLSDFFVYKDRDNNDLLIGYSYLNSTLYVYKIDFKLYWFSKENLYVGHPFHLFQKINQSLIMQNTNDNSVSEIFPSWKDAKGQRWPNNTTVLFDHTEILNASELKVCNEGHIVSAQRFQKKPKKFALTYMTFISASVPDEEKNIFWRGFTDYSHASDSEWQDAFRLHVTCYHKTWDGLLFCGYDGFLGIWVIK